MCSKKELKEILFSLQSLKSNPITPDNVRDIIDQYHETLGDLPFDVLTIAAKSYKSKNTWFPTAGDLRMEVASLKSLAHAIPSAAEAWAEVLAPEQYIAGVFCDAGAALAESAANAAGGDYWRKNSEYDDHMKKCPICKNGRLEKVYSHPAVKNTVARLGGVDAILTTKSMRAADRARFIEAYNLIVSREKEKAMMPPDVARFVQREQAAIAGGANVEIGLLAERMRA